MGALTSMGALEMGLSEDELRPLVDAWRASNLNIVRFWWDVDSVVKTAVKQHIRTCVNALRFECKSGILFITLSSGRSFSYVKLKIGEDRFGGGSVTYEDVGITKKWERIGSYGPKFVEDIVQVVNRDLLCFAMCNLSHCIIFGHVYDELIIEYSLEISLADVCVQMSRSPNWLPDILISGDGYETSFYKKD